MTIQEAAYKILLEVNKPLKSRELARWALDRGWLTSEAKDPGLSLAQTIEKNIRSQAYNNPTLIFVHTREGRQIGLPEWENEERERVLEAQPDREQLRVSLSSEVAKNLRLAHQAGVADTFDDTVEEVLKRGLAASKDSIRKGLMAQLDRLGEF